MDFRRIKFHKDTIVSKVNLPRLPSNFVPTSLGYTKDGALGQYRGPRGLHAHEFSNHWEIHRDYGEPSTLEGALTHVVQDAPEIAVGGLIGLAAAKKTYDSRRWTSPNAVLEAAAAGVVSGLLAGGLTYILTHLDS